MPYRFQERDIICKANFMNVDYGTYIHTNTYDGLYDIKYKDRCTDIIITSICRSPNGGEYDEEDDEEDNDDKKIICYYNGDKHYNTYRNYDTRFMDNMSQRTIKEFMKVCPINILHISPDINLFINLKSLKIMLQNFNIEFPKDIILYNLESIDCEYCNFKSLPNKNNFPKLKRLKFIHNKIKLLDKLEYKHLEEIYLNNNEIESFPDNCDMPNIKIIDITSNKFTSLISLFQFKNLDILKYYNNPIQYSNDEIKEFLINIEKKTKYT
jgi:hypothetical protein